MGAIDGCTCEFNPEIRRACKCNEFKCYEFDALDMANQCTITLRAKGLNRWRWRIRLALPLLFLGAWIAGVGGLEVISDALDIREIKGDEDDDTHQHTD